MISVQNVTKQFSNGKGLFHITFDVKEGEVFGYLGPNGAGKSTTIRNLMGFIKPTSGKSSILDWIVGMKQRKFKGKLVICRVKFLLLKE